MLKKFCLDCHSTEKEKGELDLERFGTLAKVRAAPKVWVKVVEMIEDGEMPPKKEAQFSAAERKAFLGWVKNYLDAEALANAGDPGRVVLRRLSSAEYTYTIQDLTGVKLSPAREFPVDGAAGEGFMNVGDAMAMSPALVQKYLDAGKEVAAHAVLTPSGLRFSLGTSRRDWADELLYGIRTIYARHTSGTAATDKVYAWDPAALNRAMNTSGRVDPKPYLAALITHRDRLQKNPEAAAEVAREAKLNAKYLRQLVDLLVDENPSQLLRGMRDELRAAKPADAARLAADIRRWQDRLWKFDAVGQVGRAGRSKAWMNPVTPLSARQDFRLKLPANANGEITVYLAAGDAGDGAAGDVVVWSQPRLVVAGQPPIPLSSVKALAPRMAMLKLNELRRTDQYLNVIAEAHASGKPIEAVAKGRGLDARLLANWAAAVQLGKFAQPVVKGRFTKKNSNIGGYADIRGWGVAATPSMLVNASKDTRRFSTLIVPGRSVHVHPSPTQEAIVWWRSPLAGKVRLTGFFADSDAVCGNGAAWRVELIGSAGAATIASGVFDNGKRSVFAPKQDFAVQPGDLLKLVVNARDRSHVCDTTEVSLTVTEQAGKKRVWNLAQEVVDRIHDSNPLADSLGNAAVWHFGESAAAKPAQAVIAPGSALAHWRAAVAGKAAAAEIKKHTTAVQRVLGVQGFPAADADKALVKKFNEPNGPLKWLALSTGNFAIKDIEAAAPSVLEFKLPAALAAGAEVVTTGTLHPAKGRDGSAQFLVSLTKPAAGAISVQPIITGTAAAKRMVQAYDDFRALFPAAMCHAQIVPVDEVVTMILYHREDEALRRLMLSEAEVAELDRLWDELFYVSQEPLLRVVSHEQLYEFATQDRKDLLPPLEAMRIPTRQRAEAFRARLKKTEPVHLAAVLELAERAWRRPVADADKQELRGLYETLRKQELPHDRAIRLVLARVLTSPAFLYRLEQPATAKGQRWAPVSNREQASRLSYFLWSTLPDEQLQRALNGKLPVDDRVVAAQARRMLDDPRTRRLAVEFASQWLGIREFDLDDGKNEKLYPQFATLRGPMYEESVRFLEELFRKDGSILDLLNADHTFLNEPLAKHYGIDGVRGSEWRRVEDARAKGRGGILGMATVLAKQSGASRTSPILRGNWVSETLLGERLPKPPANVPDLPEQVPAGLTARQLIEKHSSVAACAKCHARIDPYGFALEQYDAIGRRRPQSVDTKTNLVDGKTIEGLAGLRGYLANDRREAFVRQFCKKLLGYALGREVGLSDEPLLKAMQVRLAKENYRFSVAVEMIVTSEQFRSIRAVEESKGK
ncbi:MAG: DUF1592 domain-containing protein [Verrucomicrobia subdivision 3 bacterium]|nr:DUF1592 domain-containing protein [Limisphaerales bacterium]